MIAAAARSRGCTVRMMRSHVTPLRKSVRDVVALYLFARYLVVLYARSENL